MPEGFRQSDYFKQQNPGIPDLCVPLAAGDLAAQCPGWVQRTEAGLWGHSGAI